MPETPAFRAEKDRQGPPVLCGVPGQPGLQGTSYSKYRPNESIQLVSLDQLTSDAVSVLYQLYALG